MNHSKQLREYRLTDNGIELIDAYVGPDGVLDRQRPRSAQEAREREAESQAPAGRPNCCRRELARKRAAIERQIAELMASIEAEESEVATLISQEEARETAIGGDRAAMATRRRVRTMIDQELTGFPHDQRLKPKSANTISGFMSRVRRQNPWRRSPI